MRVDLGKIKPAGGVLIVLLGIAGIVMAYTADLGVPERYKSRQDTAYYAQSTDTLDELLTELQENVFPGLEGITESYVDALAGRIVISAEKKELKKVSAVITRDFGGELFIFNAV